MKSAFFYIPYPLFKVTKVHKSVGGGSEAHFTANDNVNADVNPTSG